MTDETTTGRLGNSLMALAHHPDQRELLRSQPDLIDNAVEELLRFDTPTARFGGRNTNGPIEVGDVIIPGGWSISLMIGAAIRDTRR
jgi:cytochrome P450